MHRLPLEPPALRGRRGPWRRTPRGLQVAPRTIQGALTGAGLCAALAGLLGVDGGIVWLIAGVWLVRGVWGHAPGLGWAIACATAGLRWGTLGLGDVQAATRAAGPTLAAAPRIAAAGAVLALAAALLEEAALDGLRARSPAERGAAAAALIALVPGFCAPGAGDSNLVLSLVWWAAAAAALTALVLAAPPLARRAPSWAPLALAVAGSLAVGGSL